METRCMGCMQIRQKSSVCEHCGFKEGTANGNHQLPVGTVVGGQYTLGKVLGQGGFGITYIGWDNIMNQRVAVKEYFPSGYAGRDTHSYKVTSYDTGSAHDFENNKKRFLREADSLARLYNVPQIVRVLRHFEENGTAYIAMEYVEGMDLRKYLKKNGGPLSVEKTLEILGPVMEALDRVHKAALVHRDISPDNIMVLPDGTAKLLDFGAARYVQNADAEKDRNTSTQAILKHGFAPPEQYSSHGALGPWTDVYAMCATVYYCLTGKLPPEAMSRVVEDVQIEWDRVKGLSDRQKTALKKGMSLQPKERYTSVTAMYNDIFVQPETDAVVPAKKTGRIAAIVAAVTLLATLGITVMANSSLGMTVWSNGAAESTNQESAEPDEPQHSTDSENETPAPATEDPAAGEEETTQATEAAETTEATEETASAEQDNQKRTDGGTNPPVSSGGSSAGSGSSASSGSSEQSTATPETQAPAETQAPSESDTSTPTNPPAATECPPLPEVTPSDDSLNPDPPILQDPPSDSTGNSADTQQTQATGGTSYDDASAEDFEVRF